MQANTTNRTLNRIGQLPELIASAEEHKIDIICIQEHRYTHTEDIKYHETGNGWSLATVSAWKNYVNAAVGGVGLLIGPRALKTLNSVEKIQPRMMAATFNGNPRATIISCYSPTNVSEENEIVTHKYTHKKTTQDKTTKTLKHFENQTSLWGKTDQSKHTWRKGGVTLI